MAIETSIYHMIIHVGSFTNICPKNLPTITMHRFILDKNLSTIQQQWWISEHCRLQWPRSLLPGWWIPHMYCIYIYYIILYIYYIILYIYYIYIIYINIFIYYIILYYSIVYYIILYYIILYLLDYIIYTYYYHIYKLTYPPERKPLNMDRIAVKRSCMDDSQVGLIPWPLQKAAITCTVQRYMVCTYTYIYIP